MFLQSFILIDKKHFSHAVKLNGFYYKTTLKTQVLYNQILKH